MVLFKQKSYLESFKRLAKQAKNVDELAQRINAGTPTADTSNLVDETKSLYRGMLFLVAQSQAERDQLLKNFKREPYSTTSINLKK